MAASYRLGPEVKLPKALAALPVTYLQVVNTDVRKSVKQTLTVAVRVSVPVNPVPDPKPETPHLITRSLYGLGFKGSGFRE